ncbi:glycosyltransferase family 4 protein [Rhodopirellula sp. JC639]|uniref:glycosyltransferase family 4 protein n=1 Tax=Stieleria mannarensis TaxID=2755585 RepID=UPI001603FCB6|nr:glycosyltransferase family 1 protein [Rhodopirellula sp. JC639]
MRVLYEGAIFQILRCGGVARYFTELIHHLPHDCQPTVVGPVDEAPEFCNRRVSYRGVQTDPPVSWLRKLTRERMQRRIGKQFDAIDAEIEHWTYYSGLCRRSIRRGDRPLIATVLDFVHEAVPSLDPSGKHIALKHAAIRTADHLICISQSTHDELCERFPDSRGKASVIPLGTSLSDVTPAALPEALSDTPYVLFVGRRNSYKNFEVVWKAWNRLGGALPKEAKLVMVGPPMKRREATQLQWRDDGSAILIPNASDALLRTLYERAQAFLFPSKAEGFGLPSLEAMAAGAPVMVSDLPVMREVAGDCGYYFDPDDVEMVAQMIRSALTDTLPNKQAIIQAGRRRAASFTWQSTAQRTAAVYRAVSEQTKTSSDNRLCVA